MPSPLISIALRCAVHDCSVCVTGTCVASDVRTRDVCNREIGAGGLRLRKSRPLTARPVRVARGERIFSVKMPGRLTYFYSNVSARFNKPRRYSCKRTPLTCEVSALRHERRRRKTLVAGYMLSGFAIKTQQGKGAAFPTGVDYLDHKDFHHTEAQ
eukprot:1179735-Prorocentrum_minimum.AAC.2